MTSSAVVPVLIGVIPVCLFLGVLVLIDSYKLVHLRAVLVSVFFGLVAALLAYGANTTLPHTLHLGFDSYSLYVAPVVEESLKAAFVVFLLLKNRVGFVVDAAILGFAIGAGFAVLENLYYVDAGIGAGLGTWIVRGFGTAIMHGGATSVVAMVAKARQRGDFRLALIPPGLAVAIVLHSIFNHFLLQPLIATGLIILLFPWIAVGVFASSERETRAWIGAGFDDDLALMRVMHAGELGDTTAGKYLVTLKGRFAPEVIVDMMCLLRVHAELAMRAKGVLMMRESGFEPPPDPTIKDKLGELRYLEKSIGATGMLAIGPFVHHDARDTWELSVIDG